MKSRSLIQLLAGFGALNSVGAQAVPVSVEKELMITDLSVVEDPVRTRKCGVWTFCRIMNSLAGSQDPALFAEDWVKELKKPQVISGFQVPGRPFVDSGLLSRWPRVNGKLDLERAPFRLLAIVNRIDLRDSRQGNAGEGRFVFGLTDGGSGVQSMTVIFEFKLSTQVLDTKRWAQLWHSLGSFSSFGSAYNTALEGVTEKFVATRIRKNNLLRNPAANQLESALGQLRTNDITLGFEWDLREFVLAGNPAKLVETTVKLTPSLTFNGTQELGNYINENEKAILKETHVIKEPIRLDGRAPETQTWFARNVKNPEARHKFALNTCNGCHTSETGTGFTHISPRFAGQKAFLGPFFGARPIGDPITGKPHVFDELNRRRLNFEAFLPGDRKQRMKETNLTAEEQLMVTDTPLNRIH